jgi:hypothetical protein
LFQQYILPFLTHPSPYLPSPPHSFSRVNLRSFSPAFAVTAWCRRRLIGNFL